MPGARYVAMGIRGNLRAAEMLIREGAKKPDPF